MSKYTAAAKGIVIPMLPEENTALIPCPEHHGKHQATLYQWPHEYAGVWECPVSGESDSCPHTMTEQVSVPVNYMSFNGPEQAETSITTCSLCLIQLEGDY